MWVKTACSIFMHSESVHGCVRVPALQMGHKHLHAHVSPKKLQDFNNKPARDLVLDLALILTKDYSQTC